ncbi:unnamed protein product [Closterium sp. NIES-53]
MIGMVEPTISLAPEAGEDFQAVAAAMQANAMAVLLDSNCSHHLMGTKAVFVDMAPSHGVKYRVLIPDVLYVSGVHANLLSAGQLKESGVQLQGDGDEMLRPGKCLVEHATPDESSAPTFTPARRDRRRPRRWLCGRSSRRRNAHGRRIRADDAAAHGRAAPLVAPHPTTSYLGAQLLGAVDDAAGHDSALAANREEARFHVGMGVVLHGAVHGPRAVARWEVLDLTDNKVVTLVKVIFYETLSLEVWKVNYGSALGRTQAHLPTNTMTATIPLLTEVDEPADEDVVEVLPPPPVLAPPTPVADRPALTPVSATSDEGSLEASPGAPASGIVGCEQPVKGSNQLVDDEDVDEEGELSAGEESTDNDVVEVLVEKPELRRTGRTRKPPERLVFHACLPPAAFTTVYDDAKEDVNLPELDPDVHADPEHHWDIARMTVKEALASWKGEAVKAAMEEEICSLVGMGTWELVERPHGVNIMKNQRVLTTKYRMDDTVEREKARLVMKGFTQVYGADYDETYSPVSSYVTLRIFLNIVAVLDLNLMQLDMKNAFLQSKLERKKSQVDTALYFKAGDVGVTCWVLVYVNDLLAASSNTAMLKELKELLEAAFELCEMSPVDKYLGLEIVRDRPSRKLWLHQQNYADKLRRRFIDEEQTGRIPKMLFSVDAYAELTFDDEEAQEREEEEYGQNVGSLQFAATTTRPDIAFACSKLGSGLTLRSDQHCREVDHCLTYLADTRDTALEFGGGPESLGLIGYVDTDDVGDKQNRTSTGGYVFIFGGAAVSWSNQRIKCTTLSSTEPEYVAAIDAGKEGRRLRFLLAEFKMLDVGKPTILRVDNKSAITVAEGLGLTGNLKHMEELYAWLQHMARHGKFMLKYIPTTEQPADFLTHAEDEFFSIESSRPFTVRELLDGLRRAAGITVVLPSTRGARRLQLTELIDGWAVDQEEQFDEEVDGVLRRPDMGGSTGAVVDLRHLVVDQRHLVVDQRHLVVDQVDQVTCSTSSAKARERRRGRGDEGDFRLVSRSRCGSSGTDNSRRMYNEVSRANRLHAPASVRTAVIYGATLDSRSAAALARRRPAMLAGRLSAVLAWLLYATLVGGRPSCAGGRPG